MPGEIVSGEGPRGLRPLPQLPGRPAPPLRADTRASASIGPGAFAEYIALPMTNVWHHDPAIDRDVAAIFDPFGNAVHTALPFPVLGEDVLITGAGPIGIMACAVAQHAGARYVVVTDVNPYRLELAGSGATLAVDVRSQTSIDDVQKQLGMKEGFDVGLEMSGNPAAFRDMLANMCHGGKIAMLGLPDRRDRDRLEHGDLQHAHDQGHLRPRDVRDLVQDDRDAAGRASTSRPVITHRFHYTEYEERSRRCARGRRAR